MLGVVTAAWPTLMALLCAAPGDAGSVAATLALGPKGVRPLVVVDKMPNAGLLLPSLQETVKAAVLALQARYGAGSVVLEDERANIMRLRRLTAGYPTPEGAAAAQKARLLLLEWALKESPWRVAARFRFEKKRQRYVATVQCHRAGDATVVDEAQGTGRTYDAAVADLQTRLKTFCPALDAAMVAWRQPWAGGGAP